MERKILNLPVLERQKHHLGHLKERNCLRKNLQNVDSVVFYTDNKLFNTVASAYVPSSQKSSYFCSLLRVSVTLVVSPMLKKPMLPQCQMCYLHMTTLVALILSFLYIWLKNGRMETWGGGDDFTLYHLTAEFGVPPSQAEKFLCFVPGSSSSLLLVVHLHFWSTSLSLSISFSQTIPIRDTLNLKQMPMVKNLRKVCSYCTRLFFFF